MKRKIFLLTLGISLLTDCSSSSSSEPNIQSNSINNEISQEDNLPSYLDLNTADEVKIAYNENLQEIMSNEEKQELKQINFDEIIKRAEKAQELASTINKSSDKIDTVTKLVSLDFLVHEINADVLDEMFQYLVDEYKNNTLFNNETLEKNLYITRSLEKILSKDETKVNEAKITFDMFQIFKDTIRLNSNDFNEEFNQQFKTSIEENKLQIEKLINSF